VMKEVDVLVEAPQIKDEKGQVIEKTSVAPITGKQLMEVEETTWIPMENGKPYTGDLYIKKSEHPEMIFPENTDGVYATITAAVEDLNLRGLSAPVRFLLTDASYSTGETYPVTVYVANENVPTATNTVTIKPAVGVTATITGATAQNVFGIYDSYVTIDGSNTVGGTTRDLTIVNTYTGGSFNLGVVMWNGSGKVATNTTIKNCIIEGSPTPTSSYGLFLNANGGGYHNTSLINNKIQNCRVGIQFVGADGNKSNNGLISGNIIGDVSKPLKQGGILAGYTDNLTITGNDIFGEAAGNTNYTQYGIQFLAGSTNSKVQKNKIHDFYYTGSSGYGCFGIRYNAEATTVTEISNNFIHNIKSDGDGSSQAYFSAGIYIISGGNINLYYNSIYMSGNTLGQGTSYNGRSACVSVASGITSLDFRNNIFQNSMGSYPGSTRTNTTYAVYSASANTAYTDINYNDYFVDGVGPRVGYLGVDQLDLTAWQTATGKDANSISADPKFESNTDLHIQTQYNIVDGKAQPIASVLTDIDGDTRNATTPDIGGDEYTFAPPSVLDPTGVTATAISGNQIDIAFTPNANNNNVVIVYNLTGTFTAPTGTPTVGQPLAGGEVIAITTTSPYSHTSLNQLTHYYYKLFSYNGTDYSPGVSVDATTPCAPISTFPWTESFEGVTIPAF
ncbi:MAG TPA: right-handed parallel beta-helix repeat-containing protein, partial [Ignavibacteriaceae bacterium]|nr:right-handed parallel beta-helix repeat-containing protein [Ignavibacteriaceae bacterium]